MQNIVTQPKGFTGTITTADLHLTPNAKYLYISNRDITARFESTGHDSIVGFQVDPQNGRLKLISHTPCERVPRSPSPSTNSASSSTSPAKPTTASAPTAIEPNGTLKKIAQYEVGKTHLIGPIQRINGTHTKISQTDPQLNRFPTPKTLCGRPLI